MKNKEKYAKEIVEVAIKNGFVSVDKQSGKILFCLEAECEKCLFFCRNTNPFICRGMFSSWANSEYKEPTSCEEILEWGNTECEESKRFTEREKAFLKLFPVFQYIAKDKNGAVFAYVSKPKKGDTGWFSTDWHRLFFPSYLQLEFNAIQWEDEEPTSREEILRGSDE